LDSDEQASAPRAHDADAAVARRCTARLHLPAAALRLGCEISRTHCRTARRACLAAERSAYSRVWRRPLPMGRRCGADVQQAHAGSAAWPARDV
jgi:hypothetical protein